MTHTPSSNLCRLEGDDGRLITPCSVLQPNHIASLLIDPLMIALDLVICHASEVKVLDKVHAGSYSKSIG